MSHKDQQLEIPEPHKENKTVPPIRFHCHETVDYFADRYADQRIRLGPGSRRIFTMPAGPEGRIDPYSHPETFVEWCNRVEHGIYEPHPYPLIEPLRRWTRDHYRLSKWRFTEHKKPYIIAKETMQGALWLLGEVENMLFSGEGR